MAILKLILKSLKDVFLFSLKAPFFIKILSLANSLLISFVIACFFNLFISYDYFIIVWRFFFIIVLWFLWFFQWLLYSDILLGYPYVVSLNKRLSVIMDNQEAALADKFYRLSYWNYIKMNIGVYFEKYIFLFYFLVIIFPGISQFGSDFLSWSCFCIICSFVFCLYYLIDFSFGFYCIYIFLNNFEECSEKLYMHFFVYICVFFTDFCHCLMTLFLFIAFVYLAIYEKLILTSFLFFMI